MADAQCTYQKIRRECLRDEHHGMPYSEVVKVFRQKTREDLEQERSQRNAVTEGNAYAFRMIQSFGMQQWEMPSVLDVEQPAGNMMRRIGDFKESGMPCQERHRIDIESDRERQQARNAVRRSRRDMPADEGVPVCCP